MSPQRGKSEQPRSLVLAHGIARVSSAPSREPGPTSVAFPGSGEVHIWQVALADVPDDPGEISATLSASERERGKQFAFSHLTHRFMRGRFALRRILAAYLRVPAADLVFAAGVYGKPYLLEKNGSPAPLAFNLSHTGEQLLVGVAREQIGVDLESIRLFGEAATIVDTQFSACERLAYRRLAPELRPLAFLTAWTRKEAYTKAVGLGLSLALDSFSVSIDPYAPARLIEIGGDPHRASQWTLLPLAAPPGHVGALVAHGRIDRLRSLRWSALSR